MRRGSVHVAVAFAALSCSALVGQAVVWIPGKPNQPGQVRPLARWVGDAMVYDQARGEHVVFGGFRGELAPRLGDTWVFDGQTWQERIVSGPSPRNNPGFAYDPVRQECVLFGGSISTSTAFGDTWVWDGNAWHQRTPSTSPPPRWGHQLIHDAARGRMVLFGGQDPQGRQLNDTWEWDGTDWSSVATGSAPSVRTAYAMAYDLVRGRIVFFGGNSAALMNDTWEFDSSGWTQIITQHSPAPRYWASMAYDPSLGGCLLFGGTDRTCREYDDLWFYDGADWTQLQTSGGPSARDGAGMSFDSAQNRILLFAGRTNPCNIKPSDHSDETWWLAPSVVASYNLVGTGCGPTSPQLRNRGTPVFGQSFTLDIDQLPTFQLGILYFGFSNSIFGNMLPFDLTAIGATGCILRTSAEVDFSFTTGLAGAWSTSFTVPNDAGLMGASFSNQALVRDPSANPLGLAFTNGGKGVIGG